MSVKVLYPSHDLIGEGVTWLEKEQLILWVDIDSCIMHEYSLLNKLYTKHQFDSRVSTIISTNKENEIIIGLRGGIANYNLKTRVTNTLIEIEPDNKAFRTNDGKASPEGRLWIGIMHLTNHNETGTLYCIEHDLSFKKVLLKQHIPNGIVWNKNGTKMYYADSGRGCIEEYIYNSLTGEIKFSKVAIQVPPILGVPDGMTIDRNGLLWVAHWGGFGVYIWDPDSGELVNNIQLPAPNIASCTFGGINRDKLYVTTARAGLTDEDLIKYPLSGSLFEIDIDKHLFTIAYPFN